MNGRIPVFKMYMLLALPGLPGGNLNGQTEQYNGNNFFFNSYSVGASSTKLPTAVSTTTNWRFVNNSDWALGAAAILAAPPTSAMVSISGRVILPNGKGVSRARVSIIGTNGQPRTALTNFAGYYRFESIKAGESYIFNISSKLHSFSPQIITINENLNGLNFTAEQ